MEINTYTIKDLLLLLLAIYNYDLLEFKQQFLLYHGKNLDDDNYEMENDNETIEEILDEILGLHTKIANEENLASIYNSEFLSKNIYTRSAFNTKQYIFNNTKLDLIEIHERIYDLLITRTNYIKKHNKNDNNYKNIRKLLSTQKHGKVLIHITEKSKDEIISDRDFFEYDLSFSTFLNFIQRYLEDKFSDKDVKDDDIYFLIWYLCNVREYKNNVDFPHTYIPDEKDLAKLLEAYFHVSNEKRDEVVFMWDNDRIDKIRNTNDIFGKFFYSNSYTYLMYKYTLMENLENIEYIKKHDNIITSLKSYSVKIYILYHLLKKITDFFFTRLVIIDKTKQNIFQRYLNLFFDDIRNKNIYFQKPLSFFIVNDATKILQGEIQKEQVIYNIMNTSEVLYNKEKVLSELHKLDDYSLLKQPSKENILQNLEKKFNNNILFVIDFVWFLLQDDFSLIILKSQ